MDIALSFDADLSDWIRGMGQMEARLADATEANEWIGDLLVPEAKENIEQGGRAADWPPLSPFTLRKTPRPGDKPLLVTRDLVNSIDKDVHPDYVDVGSSLPYARAQFYGTDKIPQRHPFAWRDGVLEQCGQRYIEHILNGAR